MPFPGQNATVKNCTPPICLNIVQIRVLGAPDSVCKTSPIVISWTIDYTNTAIVISSSSVVVSANAQTYTYFASNNSSPYYVTFFVKTPGAVTFYVAATVDGNVYKSETRGFTVEDCRGVDYIIQAQPCIVGGESNKQLWVRADAVPRIPLSTGGCKTVVFDKSTTNGYGTHGRIFASSDDCPFSANVVDETKTEAEELAGKSPINDSNLENASKLLYSVMLWLTEGRGKKILFDAYYFINTYLYGYCSYDKKTIDTDRIVKLFSRLKNAGYNIDSISHADTTVWKPEIISQYDAVFWFPVGGNTNPYFDELMLKYSRNKGNVIWAGGSGSKTNNLFLTNCGLDYDNEVDYDVRGYINVETDYSHAATNGISQIYVRCPSKVTSRIGNHDGSDFDGTIIGKYWFAIDEKNANTSRYCYYIDDNLFKSTRTYFPVGSAIPANKEILDVVQCDYTDCDACNNSQEDCNFDFDFKTGRAIWTPTI